MDDDDVAAAVESEGQNGKHDEHLGNARSSSGNNSTHHHHHHHLVVVVAGWLLLVLALFLSTHSVERLVFWRQKPRQPSFLREGGGEEQHAEHPGEVKDSGTAALYFSSYSSCAREEKNENCMGL